MRQHWHGHIHIKYIYTFKYVFMYIKLITHTYIYIYKLYRRIFQCVHICIYKCVIPFIYKSVLRSLRNPPQNQERTDCWGSDKKLKDYFQKLFPDGTIERVYIAPWWRVVELHWHLARANDTVDGSEILRKSIKVGSLSQYLTGVPPTSQVVSRISEASSGKAWMEGLGMRYFPDGKWRAIWSSIGQKSP